VSIGFGQKTFQNFLTRIRELLLYITQGHYGSGVSQRGVKNDLMAIKISVEKNVKNFVPNLSFSTLYNIRRG